MIPNIARARPGGVQAAIALAAFMLPMLVAAAAPALQTAPELAEAIERAPVTLDGEELFKLRGISSFPAEQRARAVAERIKAIADDESIPISELRLVDVHDRTTVLSGERNIVAVYDADARAEEVERRQGLAEFYRIAIARAIERYRHERSAAYLRVHGIQAAIMLGFRVALLFGMRWVFRWMRQAVERYFQSHLKELEARSFRLLSVEELKAAWQNGLRVVHFLVGFVLVVAYVD